MFVCLLILEVCVFDHVLPFLASQVILCECAVLESTGSLAFYHTLHANKGRYWVLRRSIQALLRASYINERTGGGRSRLCQCLVSLNPSEAALLHRWTSLKVKTFPHQGFVKENGCIFLEAIIFISLSVLESNPHKLSASGLTGLSVCC